MKKMIAATVAFMMMLSVSMFAQNATAAATPSKKAKMAHATKDATQTVASAQPSTEKTKPAKSSKKHKKHKKAKKAATQN